MTEFQKIVKGLAIAFAIFLTITIFSGIFSVVRFSFGGLSSTGNKAAGEKSENLNLYDADEVKSIKLDQVVCNIEIVEGEKFSVLSKNVDSYKERLNSSGVLVIEQEGFAFFNFGNKVRGESEVLITVPKKTKLARIEIDGGAGNIEFDKIQADKLMIDAGAGNINLNEVTFDTIEIDGGAGNIEGTILTADKVEIDAGVGNVELEQVNFSDIVLDCGMGNIEIAGTVKGDNEIDCGVGEVKIVLDDAIEEYDFSVETGVGDIVIGGKKYGEVKHTNSAANYSFEIDGGVGNCTIVSEK